MIPNNQMFNVNNKISGPVVPTFNQYLLRTLNSDAIQPYRDGAILEKIEGKLRLLYGWNGNSPTGFSPSTRYQNESADGTTWTTDGTLPLAPSPPRHFPLHCGEWLGYSAWVFGGDIYTLSTDVQAYNPTTHQWEQITANWGLGGITLCSGALHNNEFYIIEHQSQRVYKTSNGINFTDIGAFPINAGTAKMYSFNGFLWVVGGSNDVGSNSGWATDLYKGTVNGNTITWQAIALPETLRGSWPDGDIFDGKMWYNPGYGPPTNGNRGSLYYTTDWITVTRLVDEYAVNQNIAATHAMGAKTANIGQGEKFYIAGGNTDPLQCWSVEKVLYYDAIPVGTTLILMLRNGIFSDGSPLVGNYCGQVSNLAGNDTFEVGFIGGTGLNKYDINVTAVQTWAAGRDFYWSKIYDRSGNGYHHTNTVGNTPLAGTAGIMTMLNGKPAAYCSTGTKFLAPSSSIALGTNYIMSCVFQFDVLAKEFISASGGYGFYNDNGTDSRYHAVDGFVSSAAASPRFSTNTRYLGEWYRSGSNIQGYYNAVNAGPLGSMSGNFTYVNLRGENAGFGFVGFFQQVIINTGALTTAQTLSARRSIQLNTNSYYSIY